MRHETPKSRPAIPASENGRKRVAIMLDLDWPFRRHFDVLVGTQDFARKREDWLCVLDEFTDVTLHENPKAYDGVIARASSRLAKEAQRCGVPLVNVWFNSPVALELPGIFPDFAASGRIAAEHLLERGFRNFACISGGDRAQKLEIDAFHAAIERKGFQCQCATIDRHYTKDRRVWKRFKQAVAEWISRWQTPVGVYVSFPDATGRHIAESARAHGLNIPEQVALIVIENDPILCLHPSPSLSSVDVPYEMIGYKAAEALDRLMSGRKLDKERQFIEPSGITARQSTDFLAVSDELVASALLNISRTAHERIGVEDVCRAVFAGRRTLERRFQAVLGRSIADEIQRLRLQRARRELAHSGTPIKQVARVAGFRDSKRLHEVFLRELGQSPSAYRKSLQVKRS